MVSAPCCTSSTLGGTPGTSESGSPPSPFCSSRLILSSFCPHCQLALSPPSSASLGTQCHCSRPPWLSLGSSWDRLRTQAGRHGCSLELSEGRELMVYGVEAGSLEGVVCGAGLRQPETLELHPEGAIVIPQSEPRCWGRAASSQPGSSGNQIHNRAEEVRVPPLLCQQLNSDLSRRLWLFDDF